MLVLFLVLILGLVLAICVVVLLIGVVVIYIVVVKVVVTIVVVVVSCRRNSNDCYIASTMAVQVMCVPRGCRCATMWCCWATLSKCSSGSSATGHARRP